MARVGRLQHESADGTSATPASGGRCAAPRRRGVAFASDARGARPRWMASPLHRKLICRPGLHRVIGVGVVRGTFESYAAWYATVDLGG